MPRFWAFDVPSWELIDGDLQLNAPSITRALSTPKALDASLNRRYGHLVDGSGEPLIREWGTVICAEHAGVLDVFIVDGIATEGSQEDMAITAGGVASFIKDQPFLAANTQVASTMRARHQSLRRRTLASGVEAGGIGWVHRTREIAGVEVDPLDIVRAIWLLATSAPRSDVRLTVDDTRSPVRIGEEERDVVIERDDEPDVEFTAGPHRLSWHGTDDMGSEIDSLAEETPFEWWEESHWDGDLPSTRFRIAYPSKPVVRKDELFFEIGANIVDVSVAEWSEHADVVLVTGQGEGSDRVRSHMANATDRLRRVHVEADRGIASRSRAQERARQLLEKIRSKPVLSEVTVVDSEAATFGSYDLGDTIIVRGGVGWADLNDDYRITSITHDYTAETQTLGIEEVD